LLFDAEENLNPNKDYAETVENKESCGEGGIATVVEWEMRVGGRWYASYF
jgi:hypothetical protein